MHRRAAGAIQPGGETHNMYGIAAVPMEIHGGRDDVAGLAEHPAKNSVALTKGSQGELVIAGAIERLNDVDVYRFDWKGGVAEVACHTSGYTTLDPVLHVYDKNEMLVGYARTNRATRDHAAVTMNLPEGTFYIAVGGSDELGEFGTYRVEVKRSSGSLQPPLSPSSSLVLRAAPVNNAIKLAWDKLLAAKSYVLEKSSDAVHFQAIATAEAPPIETVAEREATAIYRVRAESNDCAVSAPLLVRPTPRAVSRLQSFGISPRSVVLEWRDVAGDHGYRIERSSNAGRSLRLARRRRMLADIVIRALNRATHTLVAC
jgi:hypothetical protein